MSQNSAHSKHTRKNAGGDVDAVDSVLVIRLVISSVIFTVSLIIKMPELISIVLLVCAAVVAGYDVALAAVSAFQSRNFFSTPVVVTVVAVISYVIGFYAEGAALILLYQIGLLLIAYASDHTKKSALELLRYQDEETVNKVSAILEDKDSGYMRLESSMSYSAGSVLKLAMVLAVVYAIAYPLLSGNSYIVSIHRAITIILIATPMSVVAAMPLAGWVGLCYSAQQGIVFKNARSMELTASAKTFVFDKAGVFTEEFPRVISVDATVVSQETFLSFAAHAVYYSEQPFAKAISSLFDEEYKLDVIEDFSEIPGLGVDLSIGGARVTLAARELFAVRGVKLPPEQKQEGQKYYMTISGRYVGCVVLSADINAESAELVYELRQNGVKRCVLLSDSGKNSSQEFGEELGFSETYGECDTDKKLKLLKEFSLKKQSPIVFVYSSGIESHSEADVDMRIAAKGKYADVLVAPEYISNIPFSLQVCERVREVSTINAVFAFSIKAILIFLSMIGFCNVWFAIFIDMVAACATILNTIRVTKESVLNVIRYKIG